MILKFQWISIFKSIISLKHPYPPQPPYPHCVEKGGETHFRAGFSPRSNFLGKGVGGGVKTRLMMRY